MTKKSSYYLSTSASFYLTKSGTYISDVDSNIRESRGRGLSGSRGSNKNSDGSYETSLGVDQVNNGGTGASVTAGIADLAGTKSKRNSCQSSEEDQLLDAKTSTDRVHLKNGVKRHTENCEECASGLRSDKICKSSCDDNCKCCCDNNCKSSCTNANDESQSGADDLECKTTHDEKTTSEKKKLKFSEMPRRSKYALLCIALVNFGAGCGYSLPAPFFPREAEHKGASPTEIGIVFTVYQFVNFIACPAFGNFISVIGAKFLFASGILVTGTCATLFGFLGGCPPGTIFVVMSVVVRAVQALGVSAYSTASFAMVSNEFPNHISSVFALLETCVGVGLMTGPTIGGALFEAGGFGLPFWAVGCVMYLSGAMVITCLPPPEEKPQKRKGSIFYLLRSAIVWVTMLSLLAGSVAISFLDATLSSHLDQFGISTLLVGLFFVIVPTLYALATPVLGFLSDTKDIQSPLLMVGNLFGAIGYLLIGPTPLLPFLPRELWTVTLGLVLFGLSFGCSIVPVMKCFVIGARELGLSDSIDTFGLVSGLFNAMYSLGALSGPVIGGVLVEQVGFYYGSTVISGFYFIVMTVTIVFFSFKNFGKKQTTTPSNITKNHQSTAKEKDYESNGERFLHHVGEEKTPLLSNKAEKSTFVLECSISKSSL